MINFQEELIALRKGTKAPERSGDYWSPDDLRALEKQFWTGTSISEIALQMGRNEVATYQQLSKMGLLSSQCRPRNREKRLKAECLCSVCDVTSCENHGRGCSNAGGVR